MIRDGAVRCKLMVREEQQTGLGACVVRPQSLLGPSVRLPVDMKARFGKTELQCLGVNEFWERLYDPAAQSKSKRKQQDASLVALCESL